MNVIRYGCLYSSICLLLLCSCKKADDETISQDNNKLTYLIQDNPGLTYFALALKNADKENMLLEQEPYTVFAPNDNAFVKEGYSLASLIQLDNRKTMSKLINYSIVPGNFDMEKIPFGLNTPIPSQNGHEIFLTRWIDNADTVYSVNGVRTLKADIAGDNGKLHILEGLVKVNNYNNLYEALQSNADLTLFAHAVKVAGMDEVLASSGTYTVFAPNNEAMEAYGFYDIRDVQVTSAVRLKALVRRHILPQIIFRNDFRMLTPFSEIQQEGSGTYFKVDYYDPTTGAVSEQETYISGSRGSFDSKMLDGSVVKFTYTIGDGFNEMTNMDRLLITQGAVSANAQVNLRDYVSDNGVIQVINTVLPEDE